MGSKRQAKKAAREQSNARKQINLEDTPRGPRKKVDDGVAAAPEPIDGQRFMWSVRSIDHEYAGDWDWRLDPKESKDLLELLEACGMKTWREIKDEKTHSKNNSRPLHHSQQISTVCKEAQRRLEEQQIEAVELFRLRHGNLKRVWGYLQGPVFHIVWYDREHKVCPTEN